MFSIKKISISSALLLFFTLNVLAQNDFCNAKNFSFKEGEQLHFKVYYNIGFIWVYAGDAAFGITRQEMTGHKTFHITADGKTVKSYEWAYKVKDRYETYIDEETMLPVKFIRDVNEGGIKTINDVTFNHRAGKAVSTTGTYSIPKCTQDVLSSIYYARNIDFNKYKKGDKIPFDMFLDDKVYSLYIRYLGKEKITTKYGTFNAIKIAPLLIQGTIFKGGEKMLIWVSDDNNHLPLRVDSPILIGSVKVDLMGYENLRNPMTSLINKRHEKE
jgi:hypothetical protein